MVGLGGSVGYLLATAVVALATAVGMVLRSRLGTIDVVMLYLLAVVVVGSRFRRGPALLAAALAVAAFDFCFVPPYYTFNVHDSSYYLTFAVMLAVALIMGRLTATITEQAEAATARERLTATLYRFNQDLAQAGNAAEVRLVAARHLRQAVSDPVTVTIIETVAGADGRPGVPPGPEAESLEAVLAIDLALQSGGPAGWGAKRYPDGEVLAIPLTAPGRTVGVALIRPERADSALDDGTRRTLEALAEKTALALQQVKVAERHEAARVELETERLRTALLSSLSHDLRSPLSSIEGAASSLVQDGPSLPEPVRLDLAEAILEEARRLHRMVGNLLDMVRVEAGLLAVHKSWQPLEEALGVALIRLDQRLEGRTVTTRLGSELPLVPIDELLIEQVFINLLENAAKYTPPGTPIVVSARTADSVVEVEVSDQGPGIPAEEREAVFKRFHRVRSSDQDVGGAGLGLAICRGIITAHGGRIWVEAGDGGGTSIRFTLPLEGQPPPAVVEAPV